jgi:hypothetical protein
MTATRMGIDNTIGEDLIPSIRELCHVILQPLRNSYGKTIYIASGYRCPALNSFIGGSTFSQHKLGQAADIDTTDDNDVLFRILTEDNLPFDQLIWEFGDEKPEWVHVSYRKEPRREILRAYKFKGKTKYESFSK